MGIRFRRTKNFLFENFPQLRFPSWHTIGVLIFLRAQFER
jgi:hypothetical protein